MAGCYLGIHASVTRWTRIGFTFNGIFQSGSFLRCDHCYMLLESEPTERTLCTPESEPAATFQSLMAQERERREHEYRPARVPIDADEIEAIAALAS
jgi:hypothetical protein